MAFSDPATLLVSFIGGHAGSWSVERMVALSGAPLEPVARVAVVEGFSTAGDVRNALWMLRGVTGPDHYLVAEERQALAAYHAPLGRTSSTAAALIPIRKSSAWWQLAQDDRRAIF